MLGQKKHMISISKFLEMQNFIIFPLISLKFESTICSVSSFIPPFLFRKYTSEQGANSVDYSSNLDLVLQWMVASF